MYFKTVLLCTMATCITLSASEYRENIEYGRANNTPLYLDAHIPDGPGPFAAAIIVHGGGWVRGDRKHTVQPLFAPLSKAGFAWFSISYRLANDLYGGTTVQDGIASALTLGAAVDDVRQAVTY